jgi:penicillin-binding protein 2
MQEVLAGTKGTSNLTVNKAGRILTSKPNSSPSAGNDVYLTIDTDLQKACYHILERNLAGILISKLTPNLDYGQKGKSASKILIPIYEVYYALIDNGIINISHFSEDDATAVERKVQDIYDTYKTKLVSKLKEILAVDSETVNGKTTEEQQDYLEFIFEKTKSYGLLPAENVDTVDPTYKDYAAGKISMSRLFRYAFTKNWMDTSSYSAAHDYYSISELYAMFLDNLFGRLENDKDFKEKVYRTLIFNYTLSGRDICILLFDQDIIKYDEQRYNSLKNGRISAYNFMRELIYNIEITPGQLGLTPCSGSIVITDTKTGRVKALVSYPSYDNNKLANKIDFDYYSSLLEMNSTPLVNRPTLLQTTTGSTFKPLSGLMGMAEGVISSYTKILDKTTFESVVPSPRCWIYPWTHGSLNVTEAIMHSCNYFFFEVGYRLMNNKDGTYSDSTGIKKIRNYATLFGFGQRTGVEISEAMPVISNNDAVRTAIGYGHSFAPVQISRYITAVANKGQVFNLTLLDSVKNSIGEVISKKEPSVLNDLSNTFNDIQWNAVRSGMWRVINTNVDGFDTVYKTLSVQVAGKTGTAQVSDSIPSHVLFVSFAPYNNPEISVTVVIPNGFQSANAALVAREVYGYYFDGEDAAALLSGNVHASTATSINVSD